MRNHKLIRLFGTGFIAVSLVCSSCAPAGSSAEKSTAATAATSTVSEETTTTEGETESIKETETDKETKETTEESTEKATTEVTTGAKETEEPTAEDTSADADTKGEAEETTEEDTAPETTEETVPETTTEEEPTTPEPTAPPETTPEPTTPAPTTPKETTPAPTTPKPTETTPAPTTQPIVIVKAVKIEGSVSGTHYIGDTLSASDFTIKVTMSDGNVLTNPAGFAVAPLTLSAATNTLTIAYGDISGTMTVTATEKPQPTQPQPQVGMTYEGINIVKAALWCIDLPYVSGGKDPSTGFDCSGLVWYCYKQIGIDVPLTPAGQMTCGTKYDMWDAQPGDIVVSVKGNDIHTGIYVGKGVVADATNSYGVRFRGIAGLNAVNDGTRIFAVRPGTNLSPHSDNDEYYNTKYNVWDPDPEYAGYGFGFDAWIAEALLEKGIITYSTANEYYKKVHGTDAPSKNLAVYSYFNYYGVDINGHHHYHTDLSETTAGQYHGSWYRFYPKSFSEWYKQELRYPSSKIFTDIW